MNFKKVKRAGEALKFCIEKYHFNTVLDVGCGYGLHSDIFKKFEKTVTSTDIAPLYKDAIITNYMDTKFEKHDLTWASHVLEHQLDVNKFLKKIRTETKTGGYTCITVPPLKHEIVGGHVNLWNAGLLMYNLVLAGFNCKNVNIKQYNYNITVIAQADDFSLPNLFYDAGDIEKLRPWLPDFCAEPFNGDIKEWNWNERHNNKTC